MLQILTPVTVITGFLGSGKTTLLSQLLQQKEMAHTAVIINEFGEVGLDHALIERIDDNIIELQSGCICCTIKGDLEKTLLDLVQKRDQGNTPAFERVIIETTGLADPVPVIHTLMKFQNHYTLDGVLTLVDAANGMNTIDTQIEAKKQAAMAERIILSKTDLVDDKDQDLLIKRLKTINPAARIIPCEHGDISASELIGLGTYKPYNKTKEVQEWLAAEKYQDEHNHSHHDHDHNHKHGDGHGHEHHHSHDHHEHHHHNVNRHDDNIQAFAITSDRSISKMAFSRFLETLDKEIGPDFLRIKGIINVAGENRPAVVQGVQNIFHPVQWLDGWPDNDQRTKLVFITRNIPKEHIEKLYNVTLDKTEQEIAST